MADVLLDFLIELGHDPRLSSSAEDALAALATERPDVILLDLYLPRMSGLDLLQAEPMLRAGVPVVGLSGVATEPEIRQCLGRGAIDFLGKPVSLGLLDAALRYVQIRELFGTGEYERLGSGRRSPRAAVTLPVGVAFEGRAWSGTCVNLSVYGIKVRVAAPAPPELLARLSLVLPDGQPALEILSLLVRIDLDGWIFRFVNLTEPEHARLGRMVQQAGRG